MAFLIAGSFYPWAHGERGNGQPVPLVNHEAAFVLEPAYSPCEELCFCDGTEIVSGKHQGAQRGFLMYLCCFQTRCSH
jgi:hypothetical protein